MRVTDELMHAIQVAAYAFEDGSRPPPNVHLRYIANRSHAWLAMVFTCGVEIAGEGSCSYDALRSVLEQLSVRANERHEHAAEVVSLIAKAMLRVGEDSAR